MISVIIPTYNEAKNIVPLIKAISQALHTYDFEIVVVDDDSPDGTADLARSTQKSYPVRVIHRKKDKGLSSAILRGFHEAKGDIVGVIDADFQHPPEILPKLIDAIQKDGYELAVGSRLVKGGGGGKLGLVPTSNLLGRADIGPSLNTHQRYDVWIIFSQERDYTWCGFGPSGI